MHLFLSGCKMTTASVHELYRGKIQSNPKQLQYKLRDLPYTFFIAEANRGNSESSAGDAVGSRITTCPGN